MCTFESKQSVLICDLAIGQVREATNRAIGDGVRFTPVPGQGMRVEAAPTIDEKIFQEVTREAIASSQRKHATPGQ